MLHPSTIPTLERTPAVLRAMLTGMPKDALEAPGAEGWSPHDVVAHLLSIHYAANVQRVRMMLDADDPAIPNVDEHETLETSGMRAWPLPRLLDEYQSARAEAMGWMCALTGEQLGRTGRHSVAGTITIADVLHHIAYHDLVHTAQITKLLYAPVEARRGPMRTSFPDE
ncbi:MAG: DinB family protein [Dehalococcoidia bacterium]